MGQIPEKHRTKKDRVGIVADSGPASTQENTPKAGQRMASLLP
jgi:hypothetical protein